MVHNATNKIKVLTPVLCSMNCQSVRDRQSGTPSSQKSGTLTYSSDPTAKVEYPDPPFDVRYCSHVRCSHLNEKIEA